MLRRNLLANYLGQGWGALMGLAFVPAYIHYLGIEAYGLIGLFAILQAWLGLFDMGMTPTLAREMARHAAGEHSAVGIRDLLRSVECIAGGIAALMAVGVALAAPWIAREWLQADKIAPEVVAHAFAIMGCVTALRFIETIYHSCLVGLQRQVQLNVINSVLASIRWPGAVGVLVWVSPTIGAFFLWQALVSILATCLLAAATYRALPAPERSGRFSVEAMRGVWQFAAGMTGVTFLVVLLTQVDKVILSRLLPLAEYGRYTLAATVAGALATLVSPITQAWYPRLCELHARDDQAELRDTYHLGAQLVSAIAGSAGVVIIVLAEPLLAAWTQDRSLAASTAPLLAMLMLGNLLNAMMWIPYQAQLAFGWTSHAVRVNAVAVLFLVPALLWITPRYGALGAAWVWVALNAGYNLISVQFMYRRILSSEKWRWYGRDVLLPVVPTFVAVFAVDRAWPAQTTLAGQLGLIVVASLVALGVAILCSGLLRPRAAGYLRQLASAGRTARPQSRGPFPHP